MTCFRYGQWLIDITEDFQRRRIKFSPDPDFNPHTDASLRRDHPDVPLEVALATFKLPTRDRWTQRLRDAVNESQEEGATVCVGWCLI